MIDIKISRYQKYQILDTKGVNKLRSTHGFRLELSIL